MAPGQQRFVERLDAFDTCDGEWREAVVEDTRTPVPEQACFRVDFPAWLERLNERERRIAQALAASYSTSEVAEEHGLSLGRVSQLRRELHQAWERFHGQVSDGSAVAVS